MNERIKELAKQSGFYFYDLHSIGGRDFGESIEGYSWGCADKFADLIVKECCDWIDGAICSDEGMILLTKPFIISNLKNIFEDKDVL